MVDAYFIIDLRNWLGRFGNLVGICHGMFNNLDNMIIMNRKSWDDDVKKMNDAIGKEGIEGVIMEIY